MSFQNLFASHKHRLFFNEVFIIAGLLLFTSHCEDKKSPVVGPDENYQCNLEIDGKETVLESGNLNIFGEVHGTNEVPEFVGSLACFAAVQGIKVRIGLEVPKQEQTLASDFVNSPNEIPDTTQLLASEFWTRSQQDGRSSRGMLELLKSIHKLKRADYPVAVFLFDDLDAYGKATGYRDSTMAVNVLSEYAQNLDAMFLILTGNVHSRLIPGYPWNPDANFIPMGARIIETVPITKAFNMSHAGGTAWLCTGSPSVCAPKELDGSDLGASPMIKWFSDDFPPTKSSDAGHDGIFYVGTITASPPAVGD
jgi:hypothetical protein